MLQKVFLCLFLFLSVLKLSSQNQVQPESHGQWVMYFGDNKITDKFGLHTELQLRNYFINRTMHQTLSRIGINYYVDPSIMFTAGYGYIHTVPSSQKIPGSSLREHRIWEQLILRHNTRAVFMEHRYRLEQRFIHNSTKNTDEYNNRIRYRFQTIFSLNTFSPKLDPLFIASYNEIFVNMGSHKADELFDRNRLYFALGYKVHDLLNFQLGYLNQTIKPAESRILSSEHLLQLGVFYNTEGILQSIFKSN